jgi:hypothetical protein
MRSIRIGLLLTVLAPIAVAYGAEGLPPEDAAPDTTKAESPQTAEQAVPDADDFLEELDDDTAEIDVDNSIAVDDASDADFDKKGWFLRADVRGGFFSRDTDLRDGSDFSEDTFKFRGRLEAEMSLRRNLRLKTRLAGACSTDDCDPTFSLKSTTSTANSLVNGEVTLDELFLHRFRPRYDLALGRLQTKFVARGGVFAKSMDRNDSNNMNINWTDGLHATWKSRFGWTSNLILQHNNSEGSSSIRRFPLDFNDNGSRISYFGAIENIKPWGPIVQRGLDISYLPSTLLKDGDRSGRIKDYWGVVGRFAARWPVSKTSDMRFRVSGEVGYAPETPTKQGVGTGTSGETDGLGWSVTAALMDFRRGHSIGLNYGRMGAGWLLSPQYRPNETLREVRYVWRYRKNKTFEIRVRQRDDLDPLLTAQNKRDDFDLFVRMTSKFTLLER